MIILKCDDVIEGICKDATDECGITAIKEKIIELVGAENLDGVVLDLDTYFGVAALALLTDVESLDLYFMMSEQTKKDLEKSFEVDADVLVSQEQAKKLSALTLVAA
jgi:hypothetical protein